MKQGILFVILAAGLIAGGVYYANKGDEAPAPVTQEYASSTKAADNKPNTTKPNMDNELKIEDVKVGTGPAAKTGDSVTVNYTGTFADGTKFDSSLNPGRDPFVFTLGGQVIQGWNEGVVGMQAGGTRKLVIPPAMAYGDHDYNGIPGGSTLYFTIDLLKIGS